MGYSITPGITESELADLLRSAAKQYGVFDDGRVNYRDAHTAPIVMCTVVFEEKILLVKRGYGLADAEGYWSTVNGFIDEIKPVSAQAVQEVSEELGLEIDPVQVIVGASYTLHNPKEKRRYIVFPCRVELQKEPQIVLNEEHTEFTWITRTELDDYHVLDDLHEAIDAALAA